MITENLSTLKIHKLTQAQYERELEAGRIDENAIYLTPDKEIDLSPYATTEQLDAKADADHTHTTSEITDFPSSLPANGGDADTVDGKHASEFAVASDVEGLKTLVGDTAVSTQITNAIANKADTNHNHDTVYAAKSHGNHVPTTETANNAKFLRNDNTWQTVTPANIGAATASDLTALQGLVGNTKVSTQITDAIASKSDVGHTHTASEVGALASNGTAVSANKLANNGVSTSLLDFAISCEVGATYFTTGSDTPDLPSQNYIYGTGVVMKRSEAFLYIELHPFNTSNTPIARNTYNNGTWYGWTYDYSEANKPTYTASEVGAADANHTHTASDIGAAAASHTHTASDVGALATSGGTLTGDLNINNSIKLESSSQGGNIQIIPPSSYGVNYWEADAYNGNLRLFAQNSDSSYAFPLTLLANGGVEIGGYQVLSSGCYGTSLPTAGTAGRIFFKKVSS